MESLYQNPRFQFKGNIPENNMASTTAPEQASKSFDHSNLNEDFSQWVQDLLEKYHIPGASVAVVDNGKIESAGYGLAQLPDVPATADTVYRMASTSKAQGAAVMGLLLEENAKKSPEGKQQKLKWSTPIRDILGDDFDLGNDTLSHSVTIEDALSNRSGLSGHDLNYGPWIGRDLLSTTRCLRHLKPPTADFRAHFKYCNAMFAVVGSVIEKIEGKSFDDVARERIWGPLGMDSTFATLNSSSQFVREINADSKRIARGYHWIDNGKEDKDKGTSKNGNGDTSTGYYIAEGHLDLDMVGPAGSISSSVNDYSKWVRALLQAANPPSTAKDATKSVESDNSMNVISPQLFAELTESRTIVSPPFGFFPDVNPSVGIPNIDRQLYALGWFTGNFLYQGLTIVHHAGGMMGFGSHVFLAPKLNFGIVIAGNRGFGANKLAEQIGRELIGRKLGISQDERRCEGSFAPKKPDAVEKAVSDEGKEAIPPSMTAQPEKYIEVSTSTKALPDNFDQQDIVGMYEHPGYGKLEVSSAPSASLAMDKPTYNDIRITRNNQMLGPQADNATKSDWALCAVPQGKRAWPAIILLHPPPAASSKAHTERRTFLNLENFFSHGSVIVDPVSYLPPGHGRRDDPKYPFQVEGIYDTTTMTACGACVEYDSGGKVARLGMVLSNFEVMEAAMKTGDDKNLPLDGYESKMIWFDRL